MSRDTDSVAILPQQKDKLIYLSLQNFSLQPVQPYNEFSTILRVSVYFFMKVFFGLW